MPIRNRFAELLPEITEWRRTLHGRPELGYDLPLTTAFVAERLREFGVDTITEQVGQSGIVATIKGKRDSRGRVIGMRADMDALPIEEATGLDYASTHPGKMHACGHDGHTAILLGAAKYLAETRHFDGTVALIFQPAEEGGAGGKAMCDDGLMTRWGIDEVYGLHNVPGIETGAFATRPGALMASADDFEVTIDGKGGHAAAPHMAVDTTLVAAQIVVGLHTIVSRRIDPVKSLVLTVGQFETDSDASNVIPQRARLTGTVRALDSDLRHEARDWVARMVEDMARAHGAEASVIWHEGYPVTINDATATEHAVEAARAVATQVEPETPPIMPSEDFSFMLEERPGAYIFLGNGDTAMVHHPEYVFDDEAIPAGCSWFAELAERRMPLNET